MGSIDTMSFVERVLAGHVPTLIRLTIITVVLIIVIAVLRWLSKTEQFKWVAIAVFVLLVAGCIIDFDAMVGAAEGGVNWIVEKLRSS